MFSKTRQNLQRLQATKKSHVAARALTSPRWPRVGAALFRVLSVASAAVSLPSLFLPTVRARPLLGRRKSGRSPPGLRPLLRTKMSPESNYALRTKMTIPYASI